MRPVAKRVIPERHVARRQPARAPNGTRTNVHVTAPRNVHRCSIPITQYVYLKKLENKRLPILFEYLSMFIFNYAAFFDRSNVKSKLTILKNYVALCTAH